MLKTSCLLALLSPLPRAHNHLGLDCSKCCRSIWLCRESVWNEKNETKTKKFPQIQAIKLILQLVLRTNPSLACLKPNYSPHVEVARALTCCMTSWAVLRRGALITVRGCSGETSCTWTKKLSSSELMAASSFASWKIFLSFKFYRENDKFIYFRQVTNNWWSHKGFITWKLETLRLPQLHFVKCTVREFWQATIANNK